MARHTPEPWEVGPTTTCFTNGATRTPALYPVQSTDQPFPTEVALVWAHNPANVRLVAAAPELLAALAEIANRAWLMATATTYPAAARTNAAQLETVARTAIAKATGEG